MFSGNILSNLYRRSPFKATLLPLTASRLGIPSHQRKLFFSLGKIRTLHVVSAAGVLRIRHHPTARCRGLFASPCLTVQRLGGGDEDAPSAYAHLHLIDEEPCEHSARGSMRGASAARSIAYCIPVLSSCVVRALQLRKIGQRYLPAFVHLQQCPAKQLSGRVRAAGNCDLRRGRGSCPPLSLPVYSGLRGPVAAPSRLFTFFGPTVSGPARSSLLRGGLRGVAPTLIERRKAIKGRGLTIPASFANIGQERLSDRACPVAVAPSSAA
jgi:hypothetical protein